MLRSLKRLGAHLLPEFVKAPLRGRLYGYRAARIALPWHAVHSGEGDLVTVHIQGLQPIKIPPILMAEFDHHLRTNGEAVEETAAFIAEARRSPGFLYDVGAHTGYFTWLFTAAHAQNRALAIEPSRPVGAIAKGVVEMNGLHDRVELREAGASAEAGSSPVWIDAHQFARFGEAPDGSAYVVPITTVDAEVARTGRAPTLLKIDVEGHEGAVLEGARQTLAAHRPVVFLELHLDEIERTGGTAAAVLGILSAAGYSFETLLGARHGEAWFANRPIAVMRLIARPRKP